MKVVMVLRWLLENIMMYFRIFLRWLNLMNFEVRLGSGEYGFVGCSLMGGAKFLHSRDCRTAKSY